ncbi:hypothetical protein F4809DRAFT_657890 [Biscogniauxia mediterranea]|nr:hypothetical protein F4809DRAFT_657890 [Biscogniauxia mediterranea]
MADTLQKPPAIPDSGKIDQELQRHLTYLQRPVEEDEAKEATTSPIFTASVRKHANTLLQSSSSSGGSRIPQKLFPQSCLLACEADDDGREGGGDGGGVGSYGERDTRVFYNVSAPSSMFICGSQGSGKSHTLSCVLEGCLIPSEVSDLPRPLAGVVFHYDTFISDRGGAPCEAAFIASHPGVKVRVLCPPTNFRAIQETYKAIPNATVEMLQLSQSDLNTQRMLDLMAVGDGNMPLYLHVLQRILREMRIEQQQQPSWQSSSFRYGEFKKRLLDEALTGQQMAPLHQRLDTLESFMVKEHTTCPQAPSGVWKQTKPIPAGTDWTPVPGQLTIVDLSCPCVTPEMACSLFNICLSLFLEQDQQQQPAPSLSSIPPPRCRPPIGRIVALDEAHKYLSADTGTDAAGLTRTLLATIRLQRHLGVRVVVSTQEPSVSPRLLDLCSATVVHRFTSPAWMGVLRGHLAARDGGKDGGQQQLFDEVVSLKFGEALLFAPSALVGMEVSSGGGGGGGERDGLVEGGGEHGGGDDGSGGGASGVSEAKPKPVRMSVKRLGDEVLKIRVRNRITVDGGKSILAE